MSKNTGYKPRNNPNGKYQHQCLYRHCGVLFRDNRPTTKYCCFAHKNLENNHVYYGSHRKEIVLKVMLRQARKRKPVIKVKQAVKAPLSRVTKSIEEMSPDELIRFIQANPDQVRRGRNV